MKLYCRKELIDDDVSYSEFAKELGRSVALKNQDPFLLHRPDGARLLLSIRSSRILLAVAYGRTRYKVSSGFEDATGSRTFSGLERDCMTHDSFFVDPRNAMRAVEAFFGNSPMSDYVDFTTNLPDSELLDFPTPFPTKRNSTVSTVKREVDVPDSLVRDLADVCQYILDSKNDPDVNLDFDDAIQFGSLCGGRVDRERDLYLFTYYHEQGYIWEIRESFVGLDGISSGAFRSIRVNVIGNDD